MGEGARLLQEVADIPVVALTQLDFVFAPRPWAFAEERRPEIARYFAELQRQKPELYNGSVLVMHRRELSGAVLRGDYLQTDFASFIAWRDWGFPDEGTTNCFALGALRGSDGGYLLGVMGGHTMNAGRVYFPGGTPDPADIIEGRVDLEASVQREMMEETGLGEAELTPAAGWQAVLAGRRLALIKLLQADEPAEALRRRILTNMADQENPELADIHVVRDAGDIDDRIPPFVRAYFAQLWGVT